jgi:hypothetical protein
MSRGLVQPNMQTGMGCLAFLLPEAMGGREEGL